MHQFSKDEIHFLSHSSCNFHSNISLYEVLILLIFHFHKLKVEFDNVSCSSLCWSNESLFNCSCNQQSILVWLFPLLQLLVCYPRKSVQNQVLPNNFSCLKKIEKKCLRPPKFGCNLISAKSASTQQNWQS